MSRAARVVRLEGELTIYRAAELRAELQEALAEGADVDLDLANVSEIDSAGVQLLMLSRREAIRAGREWRLTATSPAVDETFALLDLQGLFGVRAVSGVCP